MNKLTGFTLSLVLLFFAPMAKASELYSQSFGAHEDPAIIFLHGGPGYNSFLFENGVAEKLAQKGYYVIVYDQRGSGRSEQTTKNEYTFEEANQDLLDILKQYKIKKASLLGHSFGGQVAIHFLEKHPQAVEKLILTSAPLSFPEMYKRIHHNCRNRYEAANNQTQLNYLSMLEKMPADSLDYSSYSFMHAMGCDLYQPAKPTQAARDIYKDLMNHPQKRLMSYATQAPVAGFFKNEHYTTLDATGKIKQLVKLKPIYAMMGEEDGLFDQGAFQKLQLLLGADKVTIFSDASHNVFIDQNEAFIVQLDTYLKSHY